MSKFSQFLKGSAKKPTKRPVPRSLDEIKKELATTSYELGQARYHQEVYQKDAENKIRRMDELNREGTERQALDKAATASQAVKNG